MKFNKYYLLILVVIIAFLITNPSYSKFNNYSKEIPLRGIYTYTKGTFNGFIFSIYSKEIVYTWSGDLYYHKEDEEIGSITTVKYLGILSNFFKISEVAKKATGSLK